MTTELERNKRAVYERMQEARAVQRETQDPEERFQQAERLRILRGMYRDLCEELARQRSPEAKGRRTAARQRTVAADGVSWEALERCFVTFDTVEASRWVDLNPLSMTAAQSRVLRQLIENVIASLQPKSRAYFAAHMQGEGAAEIARCYGVGRATVSRLLRRTEDRIFQAICAHGYIEECMSREGFDLLRFAARAQLLTDRQRELLYLLLTDRTTMADVAAVIGRNRSTVCRTNERIVARFAALCLSDYAVRARKIDRREWRNRTEKEIAELLGLRPAFYYRYVCRGERVGPYTRYVYEILKRRGQNAKDAAQALGVGVRTVEKYRRRYPDADVSALPEPAPYQPQPVQYKAGTPSLRRAVSTIGGATIGDAVSAETYQRMLRLSVQSERSDRMSYYGEKWSVNGLHCGLIHRDHGTKGQYVLYFERCFVKLPQIEQTDWSHLTVQWLPEDREAEESVLPEGYSFELTGIEYDYKLKTYRVTIKTAREYLGDVTAYQEEIDALTAQAAEYQRAVAAGAQEIDALNLQLAEADELAIALYEAQSAAGGEGGAAV